MYEVGQSIYRRTCWRICTQFVQMPHLSRLESIHRLRHHQTLHKIKAGIVRVVILMLILNELKGTVRHSFLFYKQWQYDIYVRNGTKNLPAEMLADL